MNGLKTFNFRTKENTKGKRITVSGLQVGNQLRIGSAEWNPIYKLPFCRSKGRELAYGRAIECPIAILDLEDNQDAIEAFNNYAKAWRNSKY